LLIAAGVFVGAFTVYGFNYYLLNSTSGHFTQARRAAAQRPMGKLGRVGVLMFS